MPQCQSAHSLLARTLGTQHPEWSYCITAWTGTGRVKVFAIRDSALEAEVCRKHLIADGERIVQLDIVPHRTSAHERTHPKED
jgi:hypothetical protein